MKKKRKHQSIVVSQDKKTCRFINQLEEKKVIWGYTVVFDEEKIGLNHFMVMMRRTVEKFEKVTADKTVSRKIEYIAVELGITIESSVYVYGEYEWIITIIAENIRQVKKFVDSGVVLHSGVIERITIMQTLMFIKKHYILNSDRKKLKNFL